MIKIIFTLLTLFILISINSQSKELKNDEKKIDSTLLNCLETRLIGPALTSGRIIDFAVNPYDHSNYYVGVACGGVWKTSNSGITFEPVFDDQKSFSIGCVTLDPTNPSIVWVGTGENNSQRSVSWGDGIYRSLNGGKSWENMGLKESKHIGKIIINPENTSIMYVAAFGPLWGSGGDRGLFKSTDGGKTWEASLKISDITGVSDIAMDPRDPNVLYASSYQRARRVWTLINGGPEAAIYKTTNAGKDWIKLSTGLPSGELGRIGLAISPANPDYIYALIEATGDKGGFFRSTDRGGSWTKQFNYESTSAQYYQEIFCDPYDPDKVFSIDTYTKYTLDGGKTWNNLGLKRRHVDDHALWIDPNNTDHLLIGGDGGIYETFDHGVNWRHFNNLPVTQFYRIAVDNSEPFYWVYGGTQDNNTWGGPTRNIESGGISNEDWIMVVGGDGYEPAIDPINPDIVYGQWQYGNLVRFDKKSGELFRMQPIAEEGEELRWNWDTPFLISKHDNKRLYIAANRVYRTNDMGMSWQAISPDLTRKIDRDQLEIMGKIWGPDAVAKNASTSLYGNIVSLSESPINQDLIVVGTDDGLIQITEDGGKTWRKIEKIGGLPDKIYVSDVLNSSHDENVIYVTFNDHKSNIFKPYVFKSIDKGKTWQSLANNLPIDEPVWTIAEDHINKDLLFLGTEYSLYTSIDCGNSWAKISNGLPPIAIRDLDIQTRENDLAIGTFGRGIYVIDDYSPLRELNKEIIEKDAHIFPIKTAKMYQESGARSRDYQGEDSWRAPNPKIGATFTYYLKNSEKTKKDIRIEAEKQAEKDKKAIKYPTMEELIAENREDAPYLLFSIYDESGYLVRNLTAPAIKGIKRITWDMTYPSVNPISAKTITNTNSGMPVLPGKYFVSLSKVVDGIQTELVSKVPFETTPLKINPIQANNPKEAAEFKMKVNDLQKAYLGANKSLNELNDRTALYKNAILNTPETNLKLLDKIKVIESNLKNIEVALNGNSLIAAKNANQTPSISDRLTNDIIYAIIWTSGDISKTAMDSYNIIGRKLPPLLDSMKQIASIDLKSIESELDKLGAPWTPGRIPTWKP